MLSHSICEFTLNDLRNYNRKSDIRQAIEALRKYIKMLNTEEGKQTDIADTLPYCRMKSDIFNAIHELEAQLSNDVATTNMQDMNIKYPSGTVFLDVTTGEMYMVTKEHNLMNLF